jgi:hypothetical protein
MTAEAPEETLTRKELLRQAAIVTRTAHAKKLVEQYGWEQAEADGCAKRTYSNRWLSRFSDSSLRGFLT